MGRARRPGIRLVIEVALLVSTVGVFALPASHTAVADDTSLSASESWVAHQTAAGEVADLGDQHPGDNTVGTAFLVSLLMDQVHGVNVTTAGVRINHATIKGGVYLPNADIAHYIELKNCKFSGDVDFSRSRFRGGAVFDGTEFAGTNFYEATADTELDFNKATFNGQSTFQNATVHGVLNMTNAMFADSSEANFNALTVDRSAFLTGARFKGDVNLDAATIGYQLDASQAIFEKAANIAISRIGGFAAFVGTVFGAGLDLSSSSVASLFVEASKDRVHIATLDLSKSSISGMLQLTDITVERLLGSNLHVLGPTFIAGLTATMEADLSHASFTELDVRDDLQLPSDSRTIQVAGMNYKSIQGSWHGVRLLIQKAQYDPMSYQNLEVTIQHLGDFGAADGVLAEDKGRERIELWQSHQYFRWLVNIVSGLLENYGRNPEQAMFLGLGLVILGAAVFRPRFMVMVQGASTGDKAERSSDDSPNASGEYNPLAYSLGVFIPGLQLPVVTRWEPRRIDRGGEWETLLCQLVAGYRHVHRILGWAAAAVLLAFFTGILPKG